MSYDMVFLAAGEGFEPSHTESESAVLPLHKPAIFKALDYYNKFEGFVKENLKKSENNLFVRSG